MFAVIYRFKLKPHQEAIYKECWNTMVNYFMEKRGALGSCLHKGDEGLWMAYSRWPDKATRDAAWPIKNMQVLPDNVYDAICILHTIKEENQQLEQYEEICLDVIDDKILNK